MSKCNWFYVSDGVKLSCTRSSNHICFIFTCGWPGQAQAHVASIGKSHDLAMHHGIQVGIWHCFGGGQHVQSVHSTGNDATDEQASMSKAGRTDVASAKSWD